jgi:hypothetical protein
MTTWIQLSADTAHGLYQVPLDIASMENNTFWGMEPFPMTSVFAMDGPWPFLALLRNPDRPDVVTFQICTIQPEALEFEGFNPLTTILGYLALDKQAWADLVRLLESYAEQSMPECKNHQKAFSEIRGKQVVDFLLHPEWFPDSEKYYYQQSREPLAETGIEEVTTILILSISQDRPPRSFLRIAQFPLRALQDPAFTPLDHAIGKVDLDVCGLQELATLLRERFL